MRELNAVFDEIFSLFKSGDLQKTLKKIEESENLVIPDESPDYKKFKENLLVAKGSIYLAVEDLESSEEAFEAALQINPTSADACAGLGQILLARGMEKEAAEMFKWALKYDPRHPASLKAVNEIAVYLNQPPPSQPAADIKDSGKYIVEAYDFFQKKMFKESLEKIMAAELIISENETDKKDFEKRGSLANFRGYNLLGLNQPENARKAFETALHYNPNSSQACAGLGEVFFLTGKEREAKVMYEWAIENNPSNASAMDGLKKCNAALGLPQGHNTLHFMEIDYSGADFFKILSDAYEMFNKKEFKKSINQIDFAEKVFKAQNLERTETYGIGSLLNFKGFNYLGLNDLDNARECFEESLKFNPNSSQACAGLGEIFYLSEDYEAAKTMFEWGVKNNSANFFAAQGLEKSVKAMKLAEKI
jgi:tetratricopeptide (TPR) repeat protein